MSAVLAESNGFAIECVVFEHVADGSVDEALGERVDGTRDLHYLEFMGRDDESKVVATTSKNADHDYEIAAELTPVDDTDSWSLMQAIDERLSGTHFEIVNEIGTTRYCIVHDTGRSA